MNNTYCPSQRTPNFNIFFKRLYNFSQKGTVITMEIYHSYLLLQGTKLADDHSCYPLCLPLSWDHSFQHCPRQWLITTVPIGVQMQLLLCTMQTSFNGPPSFKDSPVGLAKTFFELCCGLRLFLPNPSSSPSPVSTCDQKALLLPPL